MVGEWVEKDFAKKKEWVEKEKGQWVFSFLWKRTKTIEKKGGKRSSAVSWLPAVPTVLFHEGSDNQCCFVNTLGYQYYILNFPAPAPHAGFSAKPSQTPPESWEMATPRSAGSQTVRSSIPRSASGDWTNLLHWWKLSERVESWTTESFTTPSESRGGGMVTGYQCQESWMLRFIGSVCQGGHKSLCRLCEVNGSSRTDSNDYFQTLNQMLNKYRRCCLIDQHV